MMNLPWYKRIIIECVAKSIYLQIGLLTPLACAIEPLYKRTKDRKIPPRCLVDSRYGEHKFTNVNGITLHYVEKGDHSKPLLVFLHGFPEFWYSWRYQLQEFSKDYWCIAIDKRGYGNSDKPKGIKSYEVINILNDIKALVKSLDRERFTLIGHDWGALLTFEFARIHDDMLDGFVAMSCPPLEIWTHLFTTEWWQFVHSWYVLFFQGPYLPEIFLRSFDFEIFNISMASESSKMTEEDIEAYKYAFNEKDAFTAPINYYRANFMKSIPSPKKGKPPGLFILGEKDRCISQTTHKMLKERYSNVDTKVLKNGKHFIQQANPEQVNEMIGDFLKRIYKRK